MVQKRELYVFYIHVLYRNFIILVAFLYIKINSFEFVVHNEDHIVMCQESIFFEERNIKMLEIENLLFESN